MSQNELYRFFRPKTIALLVEKGKENTIGIDVQQNLIKGGYTGEIFLIQAKMNTLLFFKNPLAQLREIRQPIDMVIVDLKDIPMNQIMKECADLHVGGLLFFSDLEKQNKELSITLSDSKPVRCIGPKTMGIINTSNRMNTSLIPYLPDTGKMAFVSQSSTIFSSILDLALKEHIGFSYAFHFGNAMNLDYADIIDYLGNDPNVGSILMYIEQLHEIRRFMSAARSVSRIKPIIVLKSGRSQSRISQQESHAFFSEDDVYDAAFKRAGIVRVNTFEALFDCAELLSKQKRPMGKGLVIMTNAGGPGMMATDALADYGISPVQLSQPCITKLNTTLSNRWNQMNPIHIYPDTKPEQICSAVNTCLNTPEVHSLLLIIVAQRGLDIKSLSNSLGVCLRQSEKPIVSAWIGGTSVDTGREHFNLLRIPTFDSPERAVRAFVHLYKYTTHIDLLNEIPSALPQQLTFDQHSADQIIRKGLMSNPPCLCESETLMLLQAYGFPTTDPKNHPEILTNSDVCLMLGVKKDRDFGPILVFGMGGDFYDIINDKALAIPPLNRLLARQAMEQTRIYQRIKTMDTSNHVLLIALEEILIRLSQLVIDFPQLNMIIINPLVVYQDSLRVTTATICLDRTDTPSPMHLVISPYPNQYESMGQSKDGESFFIRPIRPEDANLLMAHFQSLSPKTVYYRFFSPLKELSPQMLVRLTQIDYDREIALVALSQEEGVEKMFAVGRLITELDRSRAEFSIVVADSFQGKGIGAALLSRCLEIAKNQGIRFVWGIVLPENTQMLKLGEKLGFHIEWKQDEKANELTLSL
ncbi:MAG: GNAT family N-acetyltransferase [Desulfobacterales bacterium]|nr:GNAT family N-acetyltransferase [Desulfobacterales bacterium]